MLLGTFNQLLNELAQRDITLRTQLELHYLPSTITPE